jgi:hypothetical protein
MFACSFNLRRHNKVVVSNDAAPGAADVFTAGVVGAPAGAGGRWLDKSVGDGLITARRCQLKRVYNPIRNRLVTALATNIRRYNELRSRFA